jgi:hypothetical protein
MIICIGVDEAPVSISGTRRTASSGMSVCITSATTPAIATITNTMKIGATTITTHHHYYFFYYFYYYYRNNNSYYYYNCQ